MTTVAEYQQTVMGKQPANLDEVRRDSIVNSKGIRYKEFKQSLKPKFGLVWVHLLCGHLVLIATMVGMILVQQQAPHLWYLSIFLGSLLYGYTLAYIELFFHEAAHYNIAPDRKMNDRLANIFIGSFVGQDIKAYRPIHFDHHRHLGTPQDTEHTYFDPLNIQFLVESLTGIKPLKVLSKREKMSKQKGAHKSGGILNAQLLVGVAMNGVIVLGMALLGFWTVSVAWVIGMIIAFPFFAALRQLLEHRDEDARADLDYTVVPHGAVNRMFGSGPIASTLGGAGFNRHMLHHWEPQISYTRLSDLEHFLMDTEVAGVLTRHRTSYARTFVRLFNH